MPDLKMVDNYVIDSKQYETITVDFLKFTPELLHGEEMLFADLFPNLYKNGLYIGNDNAPLFSPEMGVKTCGGFYQFSTKEDLLDLCKSYGCIYTLENKSLSLLEFKRIYNLLNYKSNYPILTKWVANFLYTKIMYVDHPESKLVANDVLNISNHILLEEPIINISDYPNSDIWTYLYMLNSNLDTGMFNNIKLSLEKFMIMLEDAIYKLFPLSAELEIKSTGIVIYAKPAPSSKRYMLNYEILKDTNAIT